MLLVVMVDLLDLFGFDELVKIFKCCLVMVVVVDSQFVVVFDKYYCCSDEILGLAKVLEKDIGDVVDFGIFQVSVGQEGVFVVCLLQLVFEDVM